MLGVVDSSDVTHQRHVVTTNPLNTRIVRRGIAMEVQDAMELAVEGNLSVELELICLDEEGRKLDSLSLACLVILEH